MNGPEHYKEAQRLLALASPIVDGLSDQPPWPGAVGYEFVVQAQTRIYLANVHAELAQVALTFDTAFECDKADQWKATIWSKES